MTQPAPGWYPPRQPYFDGTHWQPTPPPAPHTVVVSGPNHTLHAILTVLTCGAWAPVWIIVTIAGSKVRVTR